jgi:hypothetical protein
MFEDEPAEADRPALMAMLAEADAGLAGVERQLRRLMAEHPELVAEGPGLQQGLDYGPSDPGS